MEWTEHHLLPWKNVALIDGGTSKRGAFVMRRRVPNGSWQYRLPTDKEDEDFIGRDNTENFRIPSIAVFALSRWRVYLHRKRGENGRWVY
jgi:hypothetical protein